MTDRALSTTLSYVLALGITTVLASGLILAGGEFVSDQREQGIRTELQIVGEQLAGDLERVDRMVRADATGVERAVITRSIPDTVAGADYLVSLTDEPSPTLRLWTESPEVAVTVPIHNRTTVGTGILTEDHVRIYYDATQSEIEVDDG